MKKILMMAIVLPISATAVTGQQEAPPITDANVQTTCYGLAAITSHGIISDAAFGIVLVARAIRDKGYACKDAFFAMAARADGAGSVAGPLWR